MTDFAEKLKQIRREKNFTQEALAKAAGLATGTIQQYELGQREPSFEALCKLVSTLGIDIFNSAAKPGWISTKDRLPKPYQGVIVARVYEPGKPLRVEAGMLTDKGWWKVYGTNCKKVSYWMPLPEPPEYGET